MATKTNVILVDDLDGGDAEETILFSLDGRDYEIDLSAANAEDLRASFEPWLNAARRISRSRSAGSNGSPSRPKALFSSDDRQAMQKFAKKNKLPVPGDRGRISQTVIEAWIQAGKPA